MEIKNLTRRSFLRTATAACAASTFGGSLFSSLDAIAQNCGAFNVVLHGLFVVDLANSHVQISSPNCIKGITKHKHSYRAGSWQDDPKHFPEVKGPVTPSWNYSNSSLLLQDVPKLNIGKMGRPRHSQAYLSLVLPTPEAIIGLRKFDESEITYDKNYITATKFPLVTVLSYKTPPASAPIPGTPWDSKTYHLFAEPEDTMDCNEAKAHGEVVVKRLWAMFKDPPKTVPLPKGDCFKPPDTSATAICISPSEEKALSELGKASRAEAVHMPTCAVFIAP